MNCFKVRLVVKGYNQHQRLDYAETISPIVKPATIHNVLFAAVMPGWSLREMNGKNAFVDGNLHEDVFISQPTGLVDPTKPHYVCKLKMLPSVSLIAHLLLIVLL